MYNAKVFTQCISSSRIVCSKNGVTLKVVTIETTKKPDHWELFIDDELINKFPKEKVAKAMFADFAGISKL